MTTHPCLSISELNKRIKVSLESNPLLQDIWITGEITQYKHYAKANQYYLYITDGKAVVNCVMYSKTLSFLTFTPSVGQQVFMRGKLVFFQNKGSMLFQIAYMTPDGIGAEIKKLATLKALFKKEGFFDPLNKESLPLYPEKIGLITSLDSAAMGDFVTTLRQHNRYSELLIIPTTMQGSQGPLSISESMDLALLNRCDLIAIVRGGGSAQDLSIFNDENLCRKIKGSALPIITGIGHQTDESLADLVADAFAVTPTACAACLAKPFLDSHQILADAYTHFTHLLTHLIHDVSHKIIHSNQLIQSKVDHCIHSYETRIAYLADLIVTLNPLNTLAKGYSITTHHGKTLTSVKNLSKDDMIRTSCADGTLDSLIKEIHYGKKSKQKNH